MPVLDVYKTASSMIAKGEGGRRITMINIASFMLEYIEYFILFNFHSNMCNWNYDFSFYRLEIVVSKRVSGPSISFSNLLTSFLSLFLYYVNVLEFLEA